MMRQGVGAIGLCSWDRFVVTDSYPGPGEYAIVRAQFEQAGGTTGNTCAALARLGVPVSLASVVGDDREGEQLVASLRADGCDVSMIETRAGERSDTGIIIVSGARASQDRTIYWIQGANPRHGDRLPIDALLEFRWLLVDVSDPRLRAFLLDLPAHRSPRTQLIGTMTYLVEMGAEAGWAHALRHDVVFGNQRELIALTGSATIEAAVERTQQALPGTACRVMFVSLGSGGAMAIRASSVISVPAFDVDVIDTTGAGDAFAAGCIWGLLDGLDDAATLARGNAVGGLACRTLGARAALPTVDEATALLSRGASRD